MFNSGYSSLGLQTIAYDVDYSIHQSFTSPEIYRNKFFEFCDHYKIFLNYTQMALGWGTK